MEQSYIYAASVADDGCRGKIHGGWHWIFGMIHYDHDFLTSGVSRPSLREAIREMDSRIEKEDNIYCLCVYDASYTEAELSSVPSQSIHGKALDPHLPIRVAYIEGRRSQK